MVSCPLLSSEQQAAISEMHSHARLTPEELNLQRNVQVFEVSTNDDAHERVCERESERTRENEAQDGEQLTPHSVRFAEDPGIAYEEL